MFFSDADIARFPDIELKLIKTVHKDRVFIITLNRQEKRNAFTPTMVHEIAFALAYAQTQNDVWCVQVEAEGPVFCAGMDLAVFQNPDLDLPNTQLPVPSQEITLGDAFKNLIKPSLAVVKGDVLAGGFLITGGCTFVIATPEAGFSLPEVKRGIFPMQVMATLMKIIPPRKVLEMCILGKRYTALEALELGLVTHLSAAETIGKHSEELTTIILAGAPYAIQKGIEAYHSLPGITEVEQHQYLIGMLNEIRGSSDAAEGLQAFKEKREPVWRNA